MVLKIPSTTAQLVFLAKLSEQCERYEEMIVYMKHIVEQNPALGVEERNLLSVAYKNVIGSRRASWRVTNSIEQREKSRNNTEQMSELQAYRVRIEGEVGEICKDVVELLQTKLIPSSQDSESKVFFLKMKGDYHRYYAEVCEASAEAQKKDALAAYTDAMALAEANLLATHPIRLGLALNFSVFYYEILKETQKGCEMARTAFNTAVPDLESLDDENYKESTLIMQLLRDNINLWDEDAQAGNDDGTHMEDM